MTQTIEELRAECLASFEGRDYDPEGPLRFAWNIHHGTLVEPLTEPVANRVACIVKEKPANEIATRLKWLRPVVGELPPVLVRVWVARNEARAALGKAEVALAAADDAFGEARSAVLNVFSNARNAYNRAREALSESQAIFVRAKSTLYDKRAAHREELEAMHDRELPGCPWDGKTLVFLTEEKKDDPDH